MQTYCMQLIDKAFDSLGKVQTLWFAVPDKYLVTNGGDLITRKGYGSYSKAICIDLRRPHYSLENYHHLEVGNEYLLVNFFHCDLEFDLWHVITGDALDPVNYRDDLKMLDSRPNLSELELESQKTLDTKSNFSDLYDEDRECLARRTALYTACLESVNQIDFRNILGSRPCASEMILMANKLFDSHFA